MQSKRQTKRLVRQVQSEENILIHIPQMHLCPSCYKQSTDLCSFSKFLPSSRYFILHQTLMLALPLMPMRRKTLTLRLRYPRKHAHLHNHHGRKNLRNTHNRTKSKLIS